MKDILPELEPWMQADERLALATVIQTWGSSPRGVGAKMAITARGGMAGSVSGGCVEGAVVEAGMEVIQSGRPRLLHFGVADETAWEVGLACGGTIDVFVQPLGRERFEGMRAALEGGESAAVVTVIAGPDDLPGKALALRGAETLFDSLPPALAGSARQAAQAARARGASGRVMLGEAEAFVEVLLPPLNLIVVGGVHISIALAKIAGVLGYRTIIIDPRRAFGSPERFAHADQLVQGWPDEALNGLPISDRSAIAVLTHEPKLDDPALLVALRSRAFYVGALGSQTTQAKRRARLLEAGLTETEIARLHGPIGLDIAAKTPEQIALAIMAEIVAAGNRQGAQK